MAGLMLVRATFSAYVAQIPSCPSKEPRSVLHQVGQHLRLRVRAGRSFSSPASPVGYTSACPLPHIQTVPNIAAASTAIGAAAPGVRHGGWTCTGALGSRSLSWPRQGCVDRLFPVRRAVRLGYTGWFSDGSVQGPLRGAHIRESRVQARSLTGVGIV